MIWSSEDSSVVTHPKFKEWNNLAFTWKVYGRATDASELLEKFVAVQTRVLGINHPNTLSSSAAFLNGRERSWVLYQCGRDNEEKNALTKA